MHRRFLHWLLLVGTMLLILPVGVVYADTDPAALQERAIQRIETFIDHFRKTGDYRSRVADLHQAEAELTSSNEIFAARSAWANVAHGLVRLGDAARMQNNYDLAEARCNEAEALARRAGSLVLQARAFLGAARAKVSGGNLGAAAGYISKAIPLAEASGDQNYLFDVLSVAGQIQADQGDLNAAADTLNRALAAASGMGDDTQLFYGFLNRADVYKQRAELCDYELAFAPCLVAVTQARADYTEALRLARHLGYTGLATLTQDFLTLLVAREQLIRSRSKSYRTQLGAGIYRPKTQKGLLSPSIS